MKQCFYIISIEKKDGTPAFVKMTETTSNALTSATTLRANEAKMFPTDNPNEVIAFMDRIKLSIGRSGNPQTMRVVVYEQTIRPIAEDEFEWHRALRLAAVSKLTPQEIEALGVEKYEIERRMNAD